MATKYLASDYPGGYTLSAAYSGLDVEATASVGGNGVLATHLATIQNDGLITADAASCGVVLTAGGIVTNGSATNTTAFIGGGKYAYGIFFEGSGAVTNFGTVKSAGASRSAVFLGAGGNLTNGSAADTSALIQGGYGVYTSGAAAAVANFGTIEGMYVDGVVLVAGGNLKNGSTTDTTALIEGGKYGDGIFAAVSASITNFGTIDSAGVLRVGIDLEQGGNLINGASSDVKALISGSFAVWCRKLTSVTNFGTIIGSKSGVELQYGGHLTNGSKADQAALITGGVGAYSTDGAATITNFGTITGTGPGVGVALSLHAGDLLEVEAGCAFQGAVNGYGSVLELASGVGTISDLTGANVTVSGSMATTTFTNFGTLRVALGAQFELTSAGMIGGAGTKALIDNGNLTVTGGLTTTGAVSGTGTLTFAGGAEAVDVGATLTVAHWSLTGGATAMNTFLTYAGTFNLRMASLTLSSGDTVALTGTSSIGPGAVVNGAGTMTLSDATVAGLSVGASAKLIDAGLIDQTGTILLRRNARSARVIIDKGAIWRLDGDVGMARRMSKNPMITVHGTMAKSSGTGVSAIGVYVEDDALVEAATGTLDFMAGVTGTGTLQVDAGAILEFDRAVDSNLTATFGGAGATLALGQASTFAATIAGFAAGQILDLLATAADSAVLKAGDHLVITDGASAVATLQLVGDYTGDTFVTSSDGNGGTRITVAASGAVEPPGIAPVPAPHTFTAAAAALGAVSGALHGTAAAHDVVWRPLLSAPRAMLA